MRKTVFISMLAICPTAAMAQTDSVSSILSGDHTLEEIVVAVRRPSLSVRLDRKVYNVGQDVMSQAGSLADLMGNIPSVDVDIDGSISLRGSDQVMILVDGKPSAMLNGKTREDALSQFAASTIERIEVITTPTVEYKPDGVGGIINIGHHQGEHALQSQCRTGTDRKHNAVAMALTQCQPRRLLFAD